MPHDVAHAHAVRARPLRLRLPEVEAPRRRPLAWDLHIVGALALRRHARRPEVMDARLQGLHSCSAALGGCTLCASASAAVGDGATGGWVFGLAAATAELAIWVRFGYKLVGTTVT